LAAVKPLPLDAPTLTPEFADSVVVVNWVPVRDQIADFGALITEYHIFIKQADV